MAIRHLNRQEKLRNRLLSEADAAAKNRCFARVRQTDRAGAQEDECKPGFLESYLCVRIPLNEARMTTHFTLDPKLLNQVLELNGERTKKAAETLALKEFIARRWQKNSPSCSASGMGTPALTTSQCAAVHDPAVGHQGFVVGLLVGWIDTRKSVPAID